MFEGSPGVWVGLPKAVLSFHQLVENSDESFLLDNEDCWMKRAFQLASFR